MSDQPNPLHTSNEILLYLERKTEKPSPRLKSINGTEIDDNLCKQCGILDLFWSLDLCVLLIH